MDKRKRIMTCYFIANADHSVKSQKSKEKRGDVGGGVERRFSEEANLKPLLTEVSSRCVEHKVSKRAHGTRGYLLQCVCSHLPPVSGFGPDCQAASAF